MAMLSLRKGNTRLLSKVNRVLCVRNLPFNIMSEEMYYIFDKYGAIRHIRIGTTKDIYDAKIIVDNLFDFNIANPYMIVLYYQQAKMSEKFDKKKNDEIHVFGFMYLLTMYSRYMFLDIMYEIDI
ncbi:hypothetical protein MTR67_006502 [Solanum verrucosum]|uniref:RRM domain-containing protein n=1 Tax=Solanum verrucosum TaxID=315347 RepID=A0AAF0T9S0_SOLVR|nr:hypothetical protein MTR67_006502 [Solanum verrucosum]